MEVGTRIIDKTAKNRLRSIKLNGKTESKSVLLLLEVEVAVDRGVGVKREVVGDGVAFVEGVGVGVSVEDIFEVGVGVGVSVGVGVELGVVVEEVVGVGVAAS